MRHWIRIASRLALIGMLLPLLGGCAKYAVLISTGNTTADDTLYHSEYWYDLFLNYQALREDGFKDEDIYVLYGYGSDFATHYADYDAMAVYGHSITDLAVNKANIRSVFDDLSTKMSSDDYLYVWWMGHGGGSGPGACNLAMSISTTGETVTDAELTGYLNGIASYSKRNVAVMTCHSGGLVDNLNTAGTNTVVLTSSTCAESSYSTTATCNTRGHAEFNYTEPNALRELDPCANPVASDGDGSGSVSLQEVHVYNAAKVSSSTPQVGDPDGIAGSTVPGRLQP